jgi:hypothetical protein
MEKIQKCEFTCAIKEYATNNESTGMPLPNAPGLVLVANWGWANKEMRVTYDNFCKVIHEEFSSFVYMYPPRASHITISTLSSFKEKNAPRGMIQQNMMSNDAKQDDKVFLESWVIEIQQILKDVKSFEIECYGVRFTPGAIIFLFRDETGSIEYIRGKLKEVVSSSNTLKALDKKFDGAISKYLHCPNIIHSSFGRYIKDVTIKSQVAAYVNQFNTRIMKEFKPFKLQITDITLCDEYVPYMHMDREKGCIYNHKLGGE